MKDMQAGSTLCISIPDDSGIFGYTSRRIYFMQGFRSRAVVAEIICNGVLRYVHLAFRVSDSCALEVEKDIVFWQRARKQFIAIGKDKAAELRNRNAVNLQFLDLRTVLRTIDDDCLERFEPDEAYIDAKQGCYNVKSFLVVHCLVNEDWRFVGRN